MIDWVLRLFRPHRQDDHVDIELTDPAEKRAAEQRAIEAQARVRLLEAQARVLARSSDDR